MINFTVHLLLLNTGNFYFKRATLYFWRQNVLFNLISPFSRVVFHPAYLLIRRSNRDLSLKRKQAVFRSNSARMIYYVYHEWPENVLRGESIVIPASNAIIGQKRIKVVRPQKSKPNPVTEDFLICLQTESHDGTSELGTGMEWDGMGWNGVAGNGTWKENKPYGCSKLRGSPRKWNIGN